MKKTIFLILAILLFSITLVDGAYQKRNSTKNQKVSKVTLDNIKNEFYELKYQHVTYTKSVYDEEFKKYVEWYQSLKQHYSENNPEVNKLLGIISFRIGYHIYTDWISGNPPIKKNDYLRTILPYTNFKDYYPESIKYLKQARKLGFNDADITYYSGWSYMHNNQDYLAEAEFKILLEYKGEEQKAHYGLHLIYHSLEQFEKSKEELVLAYQADPESDYLVDGTREWALSIIAGRDKAVDITYKKSLKEELNEYRRNGKGVYIAVILQDFKIINNLKGLATEEWANSTVKTLIDEFIKDAEVVLSSPNSTYGRVNIVERNNIKAILDEINFSYTEYISDENRIKIGELCGATHLFSLSFIFNFDAEKIGINTKISGGFWTRSKLIEVKTGKIIDMYEWPYMPLPE